MKIKVGVIGATGYAGVELIRILLSHPNAEIAAVSSVSFQDQQMNEVYPVFNGIFEKKLVDEDTAIEACDVLFACVPHGLSEVLAEKCSGKGKKLIDLGADFRLKSEEAYREWYGLSYKFPQLHEGAVYGLPELFRDQIAGCEIIANPGCYPTSIALGLYGAVKNELIDLSTLVIDSKSGTTGAGRSLTQTTHYPDCNESFAPYKTACHRHTPEIEQTLSILSGRDVKVTFVPHLLPINRGIISTMYARLTKDISLESIHAMYVNLYQDEQFVRVLKLGDTANLKNVRCSNFCDISLHLDSRTGRLIVVSAIDNMVKGAAGQAVQNMNILFGMPEETGLRLVPPSF
ncbi:N-acetyl-gamma-glutamyl-phosphate reductase [Candidatus Soleaferrea massiliensis]|uniref:N-acetyl-gamma-glutamyl-phosphate reductase n=1 Tax=Candidatus Soleaferrea massiliensis TaxID=1470354 RepID=UPI00058CA759|nr:N-acetyl-gamma-glutamyl-phosphate reductase [Candidatus Soleaferrea massiliensis]